MILYDYEYSHDLLLAQWWARMREAGEFGRIFTKDLRPLGSFLAYFRPPRSLVFLTDAQGMWFAAWFEPVMSGAFAGLWLRPDYRRKKAGLEAVKSALELGLKRWPVLIGVTRKQELLRAHERLGYTVLGEIPGLAEGEPTWIVVLTQEGFNGHGRQGRRRAITDQHNA